MKPSALIVLIGLCGCVSKPVPPPPLPPPVPASLAIQPPAIPPAHVASVLKAYRAIEKRELSAVTAQDVTPDYIQRIHVADLAARHALSALERADRRATSADLSRARDAVKRLEAVLQ